MEKAKEAREKNEQGSELEQIKLAVVNSVANGLTGLVDTDSLKTGLVGLIQEDPEDVIVGNGPWVVTSPSGIAYEINQNASVNKLNPLNISSSLTITEAKVKALTVIKYGSAVGKQVNWSKEGNITFVTDETGNTSVENPTTDTIYIKAGAYNDGTFGKITVSADGEESQVCNITVVEKEWSKIGESVTYQSKYEKDNNITIGWRLFYRDEEDNGYTYLIADKLSAEYENKTYVPVPNNSINGNVTKYRTGSAFEDQTKNKGIEMNPLLYGTNDQYGFFKQADKTQTLQDNMKAVAWYCDTEAWSDFECSDTNVVGEFAIACPPIELFIKSYNTSVDEDGGTKLSTSLEIGSYGYNTSKKSLKTDRGGIYAKSGLAWWIASPTANNNQAARGICISSTYLSDVRVITAANCSYSLRPLVAIPNANFDFATLTVK